MVLFFVIFGILALPIFIILSTIKIEIKNFKIGNMYYKALQNSENVIEDIWKSKNENDINNGKTKINDKYEIKISLKFLEKIPIFYANFNKEKIEKIRESKHFKNIDIQKITSKFKQNELTKKEVFQAIRKIKIRLEKLKFIAYIGTENSIITACATTFVMAIIGIVLPHLAGKNIKNCNYSIIPIYKNKNEYNVSLDGVICIRIVDIICNMVYFIRKRKEKKHERISHRGTYACL